MRFKRILLLTILCLLVAALAISYWQQQVDKPLAIASPTLITINEGATGHSALAQLQNANITVVDDFSARIWLKLVFRDQHIRAGTYELTPEMTLPLVFEKFASGREHQFSVSLIDGLTFSQWQTILNNHAHIDFDLSPDKLESLKTRWPWPPASGLQSLEGLFLADTYHFTAGTTASGLLARAMDAMKSQLNEQWQARQTGLPIETPYEALILASIIEKETAVPAERAQIAGVFVNRLRQNMRLQTDPTVIYGIGEQYDGNITRAHLRQKTAYNTYVIKGLPPTPIAMAGRPAIKAALQPVPTEALYFVARGDGSHQFSQTLEQHNEAVRKYQLNQ
ncbi:endolytic transglycosylase MltG [Salinimonas sp. HHU 13199]|uniref:Endolytic murein transglycosylase n=1 Tax=Salinimonas profundi TaxID=2729140 RepID=A0ABR8LKE6_9ALTE|nr:endolytic transglycosylase MltG [Salinimonas profundi]MBD3584772.1 endolytic transglycosylase MltG [Salinimonas profundi]